MLELVRGSDDSTTCIDSTASFIFPSFRHYIPTLVNDYRLCFQPIGHECPPPIPEFAVIHYECYIVFIAELKNRMPKAAALGKLWRLSSWRKPWKMAPELHLKQPDYLHIDLDWERLGLMAGGLRLSQLPIELLIEIWELSSNAMLWRVAAVLHSTSTKHSLPLITTPLNKIQCWSRYDKNGPQLTQEPGGQIRLIIDSFGIRAVDRFEKPPPLTLHTDPHLAFATVTTADLDGAVLKTQVSTRYEIKAWVACIVTDLLKDGISRVCLRQPEDGLQIWDVSGASLGAVERLVMCQLSSIYFRTVDFSKLFGITFFYASGTLFQIYPHYNPSSCAMAAIEGMTCQRAALWIYMPITPADPVRCFAFRHKVGRLDILVCNLRPQESFLSRLTLIIDTKRTFG